MKFNIKAFTLIEVLVSILIVAVILVSWFQAYSMVFAWKIKLIERTKLQKEVVFFSERLFQTIKKWWTIDYEEYFNRKMVWTETKSWHYLKNTSFWNVWSYIDDFYYCRSLEPNIMTATWWCFDNGLNTDITWKKPNILQNKKAQRYWQYAWVWEKFLWQAWDYNKDWWDDSEIWWVAWDYFNVWTIIDEKDDLALWGLPEVFKNGENLKELYLISWDKKTRTFFRYSVKKDPNAIAGANCDFSDGIWTWSWCLWNIEFLVLDWKDRWMDHNKLVEDKWQNDWYIDTWLINERFNSKKEELAWASSDAYRKPLFPRFINVSKFGIYLYPNKNQKIDNFSEKISPYLILVLEVEPSWEIKKRIRWKINPINLTTTINLTEVFSK